MAVPNLADLADGGRRTADGGLLRRPFPAKMGRPTGSAPLRMLATLLLLTTTTLSPVALAAEVGDVAIGIGAGVAFDLPDRVSTRGIGRPLREVKTRIGPGPVLQVPLRWQVAPLARLRLTAHFEQATGDDLVTWRQEVDGEAVDLYDADHFTLYLAGGLSVGADLFLPVGDALIQPYLGADLGCSWVGTYHSFGGPTRVLLDPEQNDLDNPNNIDPFTTQPAFVSDVHGGAEIAAGEGLAVFVETGYSVAFLNARALRKTPADLHATREPYGWNAVRIGLGIVFSL